MFATHARDPRAWPHPRTNPLASRAEAPSPPIDTHIKFHKGFSVSGKIGSQASVFSKDVKSTWGLHILVFPDSIYHILFCVLTDLWSMILRNRSALWGLK